MTLAALIAAAQAAVAGLQTPNPGLFITVISPAANSMATSVDIRIGMNIGLHAITSRHTLQCSLGTVAAVNTQMSVLVANVVEGMSRINVA